jgi:hypothetical protein
LGTYPSATLAPSRANAITVARPMPDPPPVTKATFPAIDLFPVVTIDFSFILKNIF